MQFDSYTSKAQFTDIIGRAARRNSLRKQITPPRQDNRKWERPKADPLFETAGERLGMDGNEVLILMHEGLRSESLVVQKALAKFLSLCKLTSSDVLADYHAKNQASRKEFERGKLAEKAFWDQHNAPVNNRLQKEIQEINEQARRRWIKQLDALVLAVERSNNVGVMCATDLALWNQLHRAGYGFLSSGLKKLKYSELSVISLDKLAHILDEVTKDLSTPF